MLRPSTNCAEVLFAGEVLAGLSQLFGRLMAVAFNLLSDGWRRNLLGQKLDCMKEAVVLYLD